MRFITSVAALTIILVATGFGGPTAYAESTSNAEVTLVVAQPKTDDVAVSETAEVTIQQGDTLTAIADANGTTVDVIIKENNLADPNLIEPGQVLKVIITDEKKLTDFYDSLKAAAEAFIEPPAPVVVAAPVAATNTSVARTYTATSSGSTSYYTGNGMWCTDYVHSKRPDIPIYGNAGYNWISAAQSQGRATGTTPRAGAVAIMSGHVAYVESVNGDGSYVVSEMGWNYKAGNYNIRTVSPGAFGGFIY